MRELTLTMNIQIDQLRKAKKVAEITESEYFLQLQKKARQMREERQKHVDALIVANGTTGRGAPGLKEAIEG